MEFERQGRGVTWPFVPVHRQLRDGYDYKDGGIRQGDRMFAETIDSWEIPSGCNSEDEESD
jgi:hypothetical protein